MNPGSAPSIALIVPTFNERGNPPPLVSQLAVAFATMPYRIVFADDSTDGTTREIENLIAVDTSISIHHSHERRGLARAVAEVLETLTEDIVVVMDGDLQHPPLIAPLLVKAITNGADIATASRYAPGGKEIGLSGPWRRLVSWSSSLAAQKLLPAARQTSDPLSGFFAIRRSIVDGVFLQPVGFKILLELLVRTDVHAVVDIPYTFDQRSRADSKASILEGIRFLRHLIRLRSA